MDLAENEVDVNCTEITDEAKLERFKVSLGDSTNKIVAYDINLLSNGVKVQPNGKVKISIPIPNGFNRFQDIKGFEVCGADSVFKAAKATVKDKLIMLTSPEVENPVAARYCFKNFQLGNLANKEGLPLIPFRTDNFDK
jgi:hypothetical protein